ncbi:MAG: hypothetical protein RIR11_1628 [Bacteroidota bacterium]|jgi:hypothetical protein
MKKYIPFLFMLPLTISAQNSDCLRMMKEADALAKTKDFQKAINKYTAAATCDAKLQKEAYRKINDVFVLVEKEKEAAIRNEKEAKHQRQIAEAQRDSTEHQKKIVEQQRDQARREAYANALTTLALKRSTDDPTLAYSILNLALKTTPVNPSAMEVKNDLLGSYYFYGKAFNTGQPYITHLLFSANGENIFSGGWNGKVLYGNTTNYKPVVFNDYKTRVKALHLYKNDTHLLTAFENGGLTIRNGEGYNKVIFDDIVVSKNITSAILFDDDNIVYGDKSGWIRVLNINTKMVSDSIQLKGYVKGIERISEGKAIAVGTETDFYVLKAAKLRVSSHFDFSTTVNENLWLSSIAMSKSSQIVLIGAGSKAFLLDTTGQLLQKFIGNSLINSCKLINDDTQVMTIDGNGQGLIWNLNGTINKKLITGDHTQFAVSFEPKQSMVATAGETGIIRLWHLQKELIKRISDADKIEVSSIIYNSKEGHFVTGGSDGHIRIWEKTGNLANTSKVFQSGISSISLNASEKYLAISCSSDSIVLMEKRGNQWTLFKTWKSSTSSTAPIRWLLNEDLLVVGGKNSVTVYDTQGQVKENYDFPYPITDLSTHSKGTYIAVAHDKTVVILDRGSKKRDSINLQYPVVSIDFKPNSDTLVTASANVLRFWDISSLNAPKQTISSINKPIWKFRFSPSGNSFLATYWDNSVRVFDKFGQEIQKLITDNRIPRDAVFTPDGRYIMAAGEGGSASVFLTLDGLISEKRIYLFSEEEILKK